MEYDAPGPLPALHVKTDLIRVVRISFVLKLPDDLVRVTFHHLPRVGETTTVSYDSKSHGAGLRPLDGFTSIEPEELAAAFVRTAEIVSPYEITDVERDYAELFVPALVQHGPVSPYVPGADITTKRVKGTVLIADLRGFSSWESSSTPEIVSELFEAISEDIVQMQIDNYFDYWKLMGDGIMLVWEADDKADVSLLATSTAFDIHKNYWYVKRQLTFPTPEGFGIAVASGYLTRYRSRTFFESVVIQDYLGPAITWASRMQSLAKPGEVLLVRAVAMTLMDDWYKTTNETYRLSDGANLKGIPDHNRELFRAHHKYFGDEWKTFIRNPVD